MGQTFLDGYKEPSAKALSPDPLNGNGHAKAQAQPIPARPATETSSGDTHYGEPARIDEQFHHFMEDAPACDQCGAITVRNGACYKCYNCGNSMGCS